MHTSNKTILEKKLVTLYNKLSLKLTTLVKLIMNNTSTAFINLNFNIN